MGKGMVALPQLSGRGSSGATQPSKSPVKSLARDTKYELQFGPKDQRALETAFDSYLEYRRKREPLLECRKCYDGELAKVLEKEGKRAVDDMSFKVLRGGDPKSGEADLKKLEDTGLALEAERRRQEEEDRVLRRASVRRSSITTKPSYVAKELQRLARGRALKGPDEDQVVALKQLVTSQELTTSETFSSTELVDKTQRETQVLMTVIEERRQRRRQRDVLEAMERKDGKQPISEYRHLTTQHYRIKAEEEEQRLLEMDSATYMSHTSGGSDTYSWSKSSKGNSYHLGN